MPTYLSPGVYVEEIASGSAPIAGVGTSTAGFIGIITTQQKTTQPQEASENASPVSKTETIVGKASTKNYDLNVPAGATSGTVVKVMVNDTDKTADATITLTNGKLRLTLADASRANDQIVVDYTYIPAASTPTTQAASTPTTQTAATYPLSSVTVEGEVIAAKAGQTVYDLAAPAEATPGTVVKVMVDGTAVTGASIAKTSGKLQLTLPAANGANDQIIKVDYTYTPPSVPNLSVTLCTNFAEFKKSFGDFPTGAEETSNSGRRTLTHAVYGFFNNGGTRCYVAWINGTGELDKALEQFEAIDEIAIVAVPGATDAAILGKVDAHCRQATQDRVAIFDAPKKSEKLEDLKPGGTMPAKSDYATLYYPWIKVYDPAVKGSVEVPPSGHIAGIYARVDSQRGVYKAPANEPIFGALGVTDSISKRKQDGLNPQGVNCIRELNGSIQVWGARTWGGDANGEFKYISTRRLFNYLRESIDEGTQWTVFEPNSPELWAKIRRSVTAFLTTVWQTGALFGATPEQAFFVKCDEETNPPEVREQGQVVTIIGVAVVKPAEFVIFRISQWAGPGGS